LATAFACEKKEDVRPSGQNPQPVVADNPIPSYGQPATQQSAPATPATNDSGDEPEKKESAKPPVEEDASHSVLILFDDNGAPFRCFRGVYLYDAFKNSRFKYYYESDTGKKIKAHTALLRTMGLTRMDCCLINKRRLNHLTGKFEMAQGRFAKAKKECTVALQKEEDDLKKIKAEEEKENEEEDRNDDDLEGE
jgi:hypothetical protein